MNKYKVSNYSKHVIIEAHHFEVTSNGDLLLIKPRGEHMLHETVAAFGRNAWFSVSLVENEVDL